MTKHIHGGDVYKHKDCLDFSANLNPLGTPESVKQAIIHSLDHIAQYPQVGCGVLRERIAESEGVKAEEVICGNGAAEVIFTLCHAVKPKRALIPAPTFAEYGQALASTGCELEYYMLTENDGFVLSEAYLDVLHKGLDMAFLCNPNNPTGMLIPHRLLKRILEKCRKLDILLVVDECFLDFVKEPEEYSLKHSLSGFNNLFILKAFTKRYAMAGVRLGYGLCSDRKLMERMELCVQPWNVSTMAQAAGLQALTETEYVEEGRQLVFREAISSNVNFCGVCAFIIYLFESVKNKLARKFTIGEMMSCLRKIITRAMRTTLMPAMMAKLDIRPPTKGSNI